MAFILNRIVSVICSMAQIQSARSLFMDKNNHILFYSCLAFVEKIALLLEYLINQALRIW